MGQDRIKSQIRETLNTKSTSCLSWNLSDNATRQTNNTNSENPYLSLEIDWAYFITKMRENYRMNRNLLDIKKASEKAILSLTFQL